MNLLCLFMIAVSSESLFVNSGSVNYCGARMCGHRNTHTLCMFPEGPGAQCSGYVRARLSGDERARLVARMNARRAAVARGQARLPPAADMLKLRWVEELAREAQRWADQCRPIRSPEEHDLCRDLYSVRVGQCVASIVGEAPGLKPETLVDMWHIQSLKYQWNATYVPPSNQSHNYADFAQMVWSKTYMVGCGRSRFMANWRGRIRSVERLVCNFAPRGPLAGAPLWTVGPAAAACPRHAAVRDTEHPELCVYQFDLDDPLSSHINNSVSSLEEDLLLQTILEIENNDTLDYLGCMDKLYLQKVAISDISTTETQSLSLSFNQKDDKQRSEEEMMYPDELEHTSSDYVIKRVNKVLATMVSTITKEVITEKITKSIVGRPKPYEMEELDDETTHKENIKEDAITERKRIVDKDLYIDYEMDATTREELYPAIGNVENPQKESKSMDSKDNDMKTEGKYMTNVVQLYTLPEKPIETSPTSSLAINNSAISDENHRNVSADKQSDEEYFSDPETVRQLQHALDRMERDLAQPSSQPTAAKVRRDLRELPPKDNTNNAIKLPPNERDLIPYTKTESHSEPVSEDRTPMLDMVLKNMPFLRQYKEAIVGETGFQNRAMRIASSFTLMTIMTVCFC